MEQKQGSLLKIIFVYFPVLLYQLYFCYLINCETIKKAASMAAPNSSRSDYNSQLVNKEKQSP